MSDECDEPGLKSSLSISRSLVQDEPHPDDMVGITRGQIMSSVWAMLSAYAIGLCDNSKSDIALFLDLVSHTASLYPDRLGRAAFTSALSDVVVQERALHLTTKDMALEWLKLLFVKFEEELFRYSMSSGSGLASRLQHKPLFVGYLERPKVPAVLTRVKHRPVENQKTIDLPDELLLHIFQLLHPADLLNCARVSKKWMILANHKAIWLRLLKSNFAIDTNILQQLMSNRNKELKRIFLEWTSWELLDLLFIESDTRETIIFEKEEEEWIVEEVEMEVLFNDDEEIFSGGDDDSSGIPIDESLAPSYSSLPTASPPGISHMSKVKKRISTRRRRRLSFLIKDLTEKEDIYSAPPPPADTSNVIFFSDKNAPFLRSCNLALLPPFTNMLPPLLSASPESPLMQYYNIYVKRVKKDEIQVAKIKSATLTKIVEYLTSPFSHNLDFMKTFLVTYQYYATPETILKLLLKRYYLRQPPDQDAEEWKRVVQVPIHLRVFNIIKTWLESYFSDFSDEMIQCLKRFAETVLGPMRSEQILRIIKQQQSNQGKIRTIIDYQFNTSAPPPDVPKNVFSRLLSFYDISHLELARQLTIIEFDLFSVIKPREMLHKSWRRPDAEIRCPNVLAILKRFKDLSMKWVPVLFRRCGNDVKKKIKTAKRMISVAQELLKLNNFNTMVAILQGLRSEIIYRNLALFDDLPTRYKKLFKQLEKLVSRADLYQERLAKSVPCIPYLEFHLKKISAAEKHIPSMLGPGLLHFAKSNYIYSIISQITYCQQTPYNLEPVTQISNLLKDFKDLESELV